MRRWWEKLRGVFSSGPAVGVKPSSARRPEPKRSDIGGSLTIKVTESIEWTDLVVNRPLFGRFENIDDFREFYSLQPPTLEADTELKQRCAHIEELLRKLND